MLRYGYSILYFSIFTALHVMQTRSSDDNSVRPSVCLSVCQTAVKCFVTKWKKDRSRFFISYKR